MSLSVERSEERRKKREGDASNSHLPRSNLHLEHDLSSGLLTSPKPLLPSEAWHRPQFPSVGELGDRFELGEFGVERGALWVEFWFGSCESELSVESHLREKEEE